MGKKGVVALVVVLGALVLLLPGCGSGDDSSATAGTLDKAAFVRQANAICTKAKNEFVQENIAQIRKLASDPKAREDFEFEIVEETLVPALEHEVEQLRALGAPAGEEAQLEQMLELTEGAIDEAKTEPETYVSGDDYRWGNEHFGKAHRLALALGIDNCPVN